MNSSIFWMERKKSFALWKLGISGLSNVKKVDKVKLHILIEEDNFVKGWYCKKWKLSMI